VAIDGPTPPPSTSAGRLGTPRPSRR
jgi:hypothetical protein